VTKLAALKDRLMQDAEFAREYAKADAEYKVIEALVTARVNAKLSQAELARKTGTTQSAIARLESGSISPTLSTLRRYAEATGSKLEISIVPAE